MTEPSHSSHAMQRVRVGMIGLAAVVLLIGLASAIFSAANRSSDGAVAGAAKPALVANSTLANQSQPAERADALAEIGAAPSAIESPAAGTGGEGRR